MKKTPGIVNCPIHPTKDGDEFPTDNCPDCRSYQFDQRLNKEEKMKPKNKGLSIHCHHDILIEYCYGFKERVAYIKADKPKSEIKTRLRLFKLLPAKAISELPKYLVEAYRKRVEADRKWDEANRKLVEAARKRVEAARKRDEAYRKWDEAYRKLVEADRKLVEASRKWNEAYRKWLSTKAAKQWHERWCGCSEWDWRKKEVVFKEKRRR